jgi:glycosyltransferase involved in cell wall biosynthesis
MRADDLTFVILTLNEAQRIDTALRSLPEGSHCFVLDAQSDDDTVKRAEAHGAVVEIRPWTDFVEARRHALTRVETSWAFMLDADEQLNDGLRQAILEADGMAIGYECTRLNRFCGAVIRGGAWANERILRLVRTAGVRVLGRNGGTLHESLSVTGETPLLAGGLIHNSYESISAYWTKFQRYTDIEAAECEHVAVSDFLRIVPMNVARAAWQYLGRGGWRDGWRGIFIAGASAAYPIVVMIKAWRLHR